MTPYDALSISVLFLIHCLNSGRGDFCERDSFVAGWFCILYNYNALQYDMTFQEAMAFVDRLQTVMFSTPENLKLGPRLVLLNLGLLCAEAISQGHKFAENSTLETLSTQGSRLLHRENPPDQDVEDSAKCKSDHRAG